eukprot:FR735816.1.p1 GENE.FR735816.1~~FR735816.1.p1  ORF type:complete len:214 (+),score=24.63 FR735816.1:276-917(+)
MPGAHQPSSPTYRSRFSELYESAWPRAPGSALGSILASSNPPASQLVCCQFRGGRSSCRDPQIVPENRRARRKERNFPPSLVTARKKEARRTRSGAGSRSADSAVPMGKAADYYPDGCRIRSLYATNIIYKKFKTKKKKKKKKAAAVSDSPRPKPRGSTNSEAAAPAVELPLFVPLMRVNCALGLISGPNCFLGEMVTRPQFPPNLKARSNKW